MSKFDFNTPKKNSFEIKKKSSKEIEREPKKLDYPCPRCNRTGGLSVQNGIWHCLYCDGEGGC